MSDIAQQIAETTAQLTQVGSPFELEDAQYNGVSYKIYPSAPPTMREALAVGRNHGDALFVQYEGENWTFNNFWKHVDAVAYQLIHRYQVKKGERVAIAMRNFPEWMAAYAAIISIGAVAVPLNSWGQRDELQYGLEDSGTTVVFCDQQRYDYIAEDLVAMSVRAVVVRGSGEHNAKVAESYEQFIDHGKGDALPDLNDYGFTISPDDQAMILYTSGTTGRPKGASSRHRHMTQVLVNFDFHATHSAMMNSNIIEKMMTGYPPKSLLAVPLFHVSGLYAQFLLSLRGGRTILMMYKWDPDKALGLIASERITALSAAPSMVLDILDHPDFDASDTSSLIVASGGGAASPPKMAQLIKEKIPHPYPGCGYGMTETNASCSSCTGVAFWHKPTSAGLVSPVTEVKTCDEDGNDLPWGETGELYIRSASVADGYWNKPDATAKSFVDGWFVTGDIGYLDSEGYVFVVDRAKDIIIRGGENISAAEVEACYLDHPAIREVGAFAVPHEKLGEELGLAVFFKDGQSATAAELKSFAAERMAHFKVPAHYWLRNEPLPRNAANKVLKNQLKGDFRALLSK